MPLLTTLRTTFTRHHLLLARLGWLIILLFVLSLLDANLPFQVAEVQAAWQVGEAWPFARTFFDSREAFARWLVFWRLAAGLIFFSTAVLLAWRKWGDGVVLLFSADLLLLGTFYSLSFDIDRIRFPSWMTTFFPSVNGLTVLLIVAAMLSLFYLFPDGRFRPRPIRWLAWLAVANALVWTTLFSFDSISQWLEARWPVLQSGYEALGWTLFIGSLVIALLIGLLGQVVRYRQVATADQRQQTKWVLLGLGSFMVVPFGISFVFALLNLAQSPLSHFIVLTFEPLAVVLIPITIAISVLRYRLWEADLWINRTLVYVGLTALIIAAYGLIVGLLSSLLQTDDSVVLSIVATGLIAILFNPLRLRLQTAVNRLMYGERDDPITVLTTLGKRLEETAVPTDTLPALVETIAQTLKLPYVAIEGRGETKEILAAYPTQYAPRHTPYVFPLTYQSTPIGQLIVAPRSGHESFNPAEMQLLQNVARQAGTAVYAAQLTTDLQRSRERLVTTREEERRRLRRDLHDGLGPQLAALNLKLDAARNYLGHDPAAAADLLAELKSELQAAVGGIRRVAHDLRPPALDQLGLVSAIAEFAERSSTADLPITVATKPLPSLPAAVEVAAYHIALEAITNAVRHAQAKTCVVVLQKRDNGLHLQIRDDGGGLPVDYRAGVGLSSMRERAAELGGTFKIDSVDGGGTAVTVHLPFAGD